MGRSTPPPRTVNDMTDEELHQMIKDHDVLRKSGAGLYFVLY